MVFVTVKMSKKLGKKKQASAFIEFWKERRRNNKLSNQVCSHLIDSKNANQQLIEEKFSYTYFFSWKLGETIENDTLFCYVLIAVVLIKKK